MEVLYRQTLGHCGIRRNRPRGCASRQSHGYEEYSPSAGVREPRMAIRSIDRSVLREDRVKMMPLCDYVAVAAPLTPDTQRSDGRGRDRGHETIWRAYQCRPRSRDRRSGSDTRAAKRNEFAARRSMSSTRSPCPSSIRIGRWKTCSCRRTAPITRAPGWKRRWRSSSRTSSVFSRVNRC